MLQVLMVDDDPGQLRIREIVLRGAGLGSIAANDADNALAQLQSRGDEIGLVVTDHNLTGRDGAWLVRQIRLTMPSLPVIVLSGMPGIEPQYEGLNVTFCFKPIPPGELIEAIQKLLGE